MVTHWLSEFNDLFLSVPVCQNLINFNLPDNHTLAVRIYQHIPVHGVSECVDVRLNFISSNTLVHLQLLLSKVRKLFERIDRHQHRPDVRVYPADSEEGGKEMMGRRCVWECKGKMGM